MFYVYEWYNIDTNEIFYVGKGCRERYKQITKRNKLFQEYYKNNHCNSRIIKYFEKEEDAFKYENERILELKEIGQCSCNLDNGGKGGVNFVWTDEMKEYKSKFNPMKDKSQRERMSKFNPMKNSEIAEKTNSKKRKPVIVNDKEYESLTEVANVYNVTMQCFKYWIDRGYTNKLESCYYKEDGKKEFKIRDHGSFNKKKVIIDGIIYDSIKEASESINGSSTGICEAIKHNRKYKGHSCRYVNQQPS